MLVLKQVSVINDLKATKDCRHKWLLSGKRKDTQFHFSGKDWPDTTNQQIYWKLRDNDVDLSDPHDSNIN